MYLTFSLMRVLRGTIRATTLRSDLRAEASQWVRSLTRTHYPGEADLHNGQPAKVRRKEPRLIFIADRGMKRCCWCARLVILKGKLDSIGGRVCFFNTVMRSSCQLACMQV